MGRGTSLPAQTGDVGRGEFIRKKYNLPHKFILYLGTLEPRKNVDNLVEAFSTSSILNLESCNLVIAGAQGWKSKKLLEKIKKTPGIRYIEYIDAEDKPFLYSLASLFVYPSLYEGFGFPVLEAMASGVPVLTSNRSSLPEVVGSAAYLVNPINVFEIEKGIIMLLKDHELRKLLVESGTQKTCEFSWEETAKKFLSLLS
jgi:glycosyltransferase involved in cell wall biosynthesis